MSAHRIVSPLLAGLALLATTAALAQATTGAPATTPAPAAKPAAAAATPAAPAVAAKPAASAAKPAVVLCDTCGVVADINRETRKGSGGAVGVVAGAAVGGVLGNQVGKGTGNTVATVGGAVAGGVIGNEVQKRVTAKKIFITDVKMKDGTVKRFEQEGKPDWSVGSVVKLGADGKLTRQ